MALGRVKAEMHFLTDLHNCVPFHPHGALAYFCRRGLGRPRVGSDVAAISAPGETQSFCSAQVD